MINLSSRVFDPKVYNLTDTMRLRVGSPLGRREILYDSQLARDLSQTLCIVLQTFHIRMDQLWPFPII